MFLLSRLRAGLSKRRSSAFHSLFRFASSDQDGFGKTKDERDVLTLYYDKVSPEPIQVAELFAEAISAEPPTLHGNREVRDALSLEHKRYLLHKPVEKLVIPDDLKDKINAKLIPDFEKALLSTARENEYHNKINVADPSFIWSDTVNANTRYIKFVFGNIIDLHVLEVKKKKVVRKDRLICYYDETIQAAVVVDVFEDHDGVLYAARELHFQEPKMTDLLRGIRVFGALREAGVSTSAIREMLDKEILLHKLEDCAMKELPSEVIKAWPKLRRKLNLN